MGNLTYQCIDSNIIAEHFDNLANQIIINAFFIWGSALLADVARLIWQWHDVLECVRHLGT
jgi:hypothetical protein